MSLTSLAIRIAAPVPQIDSFDRYLFIGPHPDDIEIGAGATAARLVSMGKKVCFIICIDGRYGDGYAPCRGDELAALRQREAISSAKALGVEDVRFLGLCDGGFYEPDELLCGIARVIGDFKPDMVFAPDPDVPGECHIDHLNVGKAAKRIACFAQYGSIMERYGAHAAPVKALGLYFTAKPNRFVGTKGYVDRQLHAIFDNHTSQFPKGCGDAKSISLYIKLRSADFGIRSLKSSAEGFRVLGVTQMHCMPEEV